MGAIAELEREKYNREKKLSERRTFYLSQNYNISNDRHLKTLHSCGLRDMSNKSERFDQKSGFDALKYDGFHVPVERKNTFHNYPVATDSDEFCSMNHQIFNNHTRRNNIELGGATETEQSTDIDAIIPNTEPQYLKFTKC